MELRIGGNWFCGVFAGNAAEKEFKMLAFYLMEFDNQGDRLLFTDIYEQNKGRMYSIAKGILSSSELADEAVHDTFLKIIDNFSKFTALDCKVQQGWIVLTTKNIAFNILKKEKRSVAVGDEYLFNAVSMEKQDSDFYDLVTAINGLPEKYRDVLEMYYIYGYSSKEIAAMLEITADNVAQRLSRARKLLLKELNEDEI